MVVLVRRGDNGRVGKEGGVMGVWVRRGDNGCVGKEGGSVVTFTGLQIIAQD